MRTTVNNGVSQLQAEEDGYLLSSEEKPIDEIQLIKSVNLIGTFTEADFRDATDEEIAEVQARIEAEKSEMEADINI